MANIKSAKKRIKVIAKKTALNKARKTFLKTSEKKLNEAILTGDKAAAASAYNLAIKKFSQAAAKGTIHKNAAARKMSRLQKRVDAM